MINITSVLPIEKEKNKMPGSLYIVATPIGNLEDITFRAVRVLKEVKLIAAEDTRQTKKLLNVYGINTPLTSLYNRNEDAKSGYLINKLAEGCDLAYVSDAGTPGISDPGFVLVNEAIARKIQVIPIPGASAVITALCASGLPMESFVFNGFLPSKSLKRRSVLSAVKDEIRTSVFYESPRRLLSTLKDMETILGNRNVVVARELTKVFEEIIRGAVEEVIAMLTGRIIKGEVTIIIAGRGKTHHHWSDQEIAKLIKKLKKSDNLSPRDIADKISEELGISRRYVYQQIIKFRG
jgi:16S rRNA (cytidine1402-2'-O)-methyltransferase